MAEQSSKPRNGSGSADALSARAVLSQFMAMASALWASRQRNKILVLVGALVAVVGATAYSQVRLNAWSQPLYNALAHKDISAFVKQLGVFGVLAGTLLVLNVAQMWLNQTSKVILRAGLVDDLMTQWLSRLRAFRLSAGEIGENPDQRIQQDAQHLTDLTTDLRIGLLQSTLLLLAFVGVLWVLSSHMVLSIGGRTFSPPPGYMVWCALLYAGAASFLSWRVGRPLINLNADHYAERQSFVTLSCV
jgi:putative ATP-binding cassette transporter